MGLVPWLILAAILGCVVAQASWRSRVGSGVSPATLCAGVWVSVWVVHLSDLFDYVPLSLSAAVYSALPVAGVFVGEAISLRMPRRQRPDLPTIDFARLRRSTLNLGIVGLAAGAVVFVASWLQFGNVLSDSGAIKATRVVAGYDMFAGSFLALPAKYALLLVGCNLATSVLAAFYVRQTGARAWWIALLPLFGAVLFDLGWGSRVNTFDVAVAFLAAMFLAPRIPSDDAAGTRQERNAARPWSKRRKGTFVLVTVVLVLATSVMTSITNRKVAREDRSQDPRIPALVVQFADYTAGTLVLFDQTIADNPQTWGRMSFWGIEQWLRLLRIEPRFVPIPDSLLAWELQYPFLSNARTYKRAGNVFTWLRYLYSDFREPGLILVPLLLGYVGGRAGARVVTRRGFPAIVCVTTCLFILAKSTTIFMLNSDVFVVAVAALWLASHRVASGESRHRMGSGPQRCTVASTLG